MHFNKNDKKEEGTVSPIFAKILDFAKQPNTSCYFTDKSTPIISYTYTACCMQNFQLLEVLQHFSIDVLKSKHID